MKTKGLAATEDLCILENVETVEIHEIDASPSADFSGFRHF